MATIASARSFPILWDVQHAHIHKIFLRRAYHSLQLLPDGGLQVFEVPSTASKSSESSFTIIRGSEVESLQCHKRRGPYRPHAFASALGDLPLANLYSKAFEIRNSIAHLQRSNEELQSYSDTQPDGDTDCLEAVRENEVVIERMRERVGLIKREVENRGGRWHEADVEVDGVDGEKTDSGVLGNGHTNGATNGAQDAHENTGQGSGGARAAHPERADNSDHRQAGGRLNDEELRRRMLERIGGDDDIGLHLLPQCLPHVHIAETTLKSNRRMIVQNGDSQAWTQI